jgi:hypothetical protein
MAVKEDMQIRRKRSYTDSEEIFESIFRAELDELKRKRAEKAVQKKGEKTVPLRRKMVFANADTQETRRRFQKKEGHSAPQQGVAKPEKKTGRGLKKVVLCSVLLVFVGAPLVVYHNLGGFGLVKMIWRAENKGVQRPILENFGDKANSKREQARASRISAREEMATDRKSIEDVPAQSAKAEQDGEEANGEQMSQTSRISSERADYPEKTRMLQYKGGVSYPYSIYLGSYKTADRAGKAISIYQKRGLTPYWVEVDLGVKGVWFRVFAGYFQEREEAEEFIRENELQDAESRQTRYANLIDVYESKEDLGSKRDALLALGYYPYVIRGKDGELLLYTGAFYQKSRAERARDDLASRGIQSRVVER